MQIPFFTSSREYEAHKAEFDTAVQSVMDSGNFILGSEVSSFEEKARQWLGCKYAVGIASGSDGLVIGADILGLRDGAEVLTPTFTFFASTSCIARLGGKPVFVDMDENTLDMDLDDAARRMTKNTRGIIPVHLFMQSCDMQRIMKMARENDFKVLEDSAEAFGMKTMYDGSFKQAGTIGDIGVYSFFPTKTLGCYGDGGLMVTDDEDLYRKIKSFHVHGASVKYNHDYIGYNSRLDSMQAAVLNVKMKWIDDSIRIRGEIAEKYTARLSGVSGLRIPEVTSYNKAVYYVYNVLADKRDELAFYLKEKGIGTSVYYPKPLHLQKCFEYLGYKKGDFPVAERVSDQVLALPIFPELRDNEIDYVCDAIKAFYGK